MKSGSLAFFPGLLSLVALLLANAGWAAPIATTPTKPYHVRDLKQDGESKCDYATGKWYFTISWEKLIYLNVPRDKYNVGSLAGSIKGPVQCDEARCTVTFSGMHPRQKDAYAKVQLGEVGSVSGMQIHRIPWFPSCTKVIPGGV
ncbi:MAG: hypothetical protein ABL989_03625 [Gammaproteobacteria bacterium]